MKTIKWTLDPMHSEIMFKVKHLMITTVTGHFGNFSAEAETEGEGFDHTSHIRFSAEVNSIHTNNSQRDGHLKSADFFNADEYPKLEFSANVFNATSGELKGDLTIRGITKPVKLSAEFHGIVSDPMGQKKAGFSLSGKISRKEFGLHWNALTEAGGVVVADEVKILVEIQLAQAAVKEETSMEESLSGSRQQ